MTVDMYNVYSVANTDITTAKWSTYSNTKFAAFKIILAAVR